MRIVLGSDHAGFELKQNLMEMVKGLGYETLDVGTNSTAPVDYPDFAAAVGSCRAGRTSGSGRSDLRKRSGRVRGGQ